MTTYKIAYWKGLRCYHSLHEGWNPQEAGEVGTMPGTGTRYRYRNAESSNFEFAIDVPCWFDRIESPPADLDTMDAFHLAMSQLKKDFISHAQELGDLSYCRDSSRVGDVNGTYTAGLRSVAVVNLAGGWTPTAGRYVLFRDPTSGEGFCTAIIGYAAGAISCNIPVAIDTDWVVVDVQLYYPDCQFLNIVQGDAPSPTDDWRPSVMYRFANNEDPVQSTAYIMDLT